MLRIGPDGSLRAVEGSPFSSRGIRPISIAVHGNLVYVANLGDGASGSNYTGFRLNPEGRLIAIPGSTFSLPNAANPGDIVSRTGPTNGTSHFVHDSVTYLRQSRGWHLEQVEDVETAAKVIALVASLGYAGLLGLLYLMQERLIFPGSTLPADFSFSFAARVIRFRF